MTAKHIARPQMNHQVRIIGGQWKRTPLAVLTAEGLRPTPDRVRETVFNWLGHLFDATWHNVTCLDLFAGTGALGFEAASRGAKRVMLVESNTAVVRQLNATKEKLQATQINVVRGDALKVAQSLIAKEGDEAARFSLIFLDPPYQQEWLGKILPLCERLLSTDGLIYVEAEFAIGDKELTEWGSGCEVLRADKAGVVFYHVLQRKKMSEIQA